MTTAPTHNQSTNEGSSSSIHSIFEDPAIREAAKDDAFVRFISKHGISTLVTLVTISLLIIAYNIFASTAEEKRAHATTSLTEIQETYRSLVGKQDGLEELQRKQSALTGESEKKELQSQIATATQDVQQLKTKINLMIVSLDSPKPFDTLAALYKGLVAGRLKDFDTVRAVLSERAWEEVGKKGSSERFMAELLTLSLAKRLAQSDSNLVESKETLRSLAERGEFVAVEAVDALSLLVSTPEEKSQIKDLVSDVQTRFPSQGKLLAEVSERLSS